MNREIERYAELHTSPREQILEQLDRATNQQVVQPRMLSGHIQGKLLEMLTAMIRPKRVLEIGTFTGYSALSIAAGADAGAEVHTIEVDDELEMLATSFFEKSPHCDKIKYHIGSALDVAPQLGGNFEMVFIDGDKREYPAYYNMLFDCGLVSSGSYIIADNILWSGKVVEPLAKGDKHTAALLEFNDMVLNDSRVESVILPIRDGLNIIRVK